MDIELIDTCQGSELVTYCGCFGPSVFFLF